MFAMALLAVQLNHSPVRSSILSDLLKVSDSYLKKIVRRLSSADLVHTATGPGGGIRIAKSADQISLGEICRAVEDNPWVTTVEDIKTQALFAREGVSQTMYKLASTLVDAGRSFDSVLNSNTLANHLPKNSWQQGIIDWNTWWYEHYSGENDESPEPLKWPI